MKKLEKRLKIAQWMAIAVLVFNLILMVNMVSTGEMPIFGWIHGASVGWLFEVLLMTFRDRN